MRCELLSILLSSAVFLVACEQEDDPLPKLAKVPATELVDHHGEPFNTASMDGSVWIADFFFTSCPTYCPRLTAKMGELRERLGERIGAIQLLSVSVDPKHDTPEVLRKYAKKHDAFHEHWTFVTGEPDVVDGLVVEGFKVPMGEPVQQDNEDGYTIRHARHFALVGAGRRVRGYYRTEPKQMDRLVHDAKRLVESGP